MTTPNAFVTTRTRIAVILTQPTFVDDHHKTPKLKPRKAESTRLWVEGFTDQPGEFQSPTAARQTGRERARETLYM